MARVKRGTLKNAKHKKVLAQTKGFQGRSKNCYTIAKNRLEKGMLHAYRDRKNKKRTMRALWIMRLNAAVRNLGYSYSQFMGKYLKTNETTLNRKMMSEMAIHTPNVFANFANQIMA